MLPTMSGGSSFTVVLDDEAATRRLAIDLANALEPGDLVTLSGDLGAGKTALVRAMIRHLSQDETVTVPSPTFTLIQTYELPRFPLVHADFYRLSGPGELTELGFDDLPEHAVIMLEWPDRAAGHLPPDRFDVTLTLTPDLGLQSRKTRVTGYGSFAARAERIAAMRRFLERSGYSAAERRHMQGDASTRSYEHLNRDGQSVILMNSPRRPDGPPIRDGKPYSAIAHLAEDVKPFVAIADGLRGRGFSAPGILHADLANGFLIIEDLGSNAVVEGDPPAPIMDRYEAAVDLLIALHTQDLPEALPVTADTEYTIPRYDIDALLIEAELLLDWSIPRWNVNVPASTRATFLMLWREALLTDSPAKPTWVLRDFHSPNLLWLPERKDIARIGLLDFQDALIGPAAYDLASLLQDARVDVSEEAELSLLGRYARARLDRDPNFDVAGFTRSYAALAAQRASKILGIFARLDRRDGKPQYLRHMPRVWSYLQRSLAHPALEPLNAWYKLNVPRYIGA